MKSLLIAIFILLAALLAAPCAHAQKFSEFSASTSPQPTDYLAGYRTPNVANGNIRFSLATLSAYFQTGYSPTATINEWFANPDNNASFSADAWRAALIIGNVDNTPDASKPVSTLQATADAAVLAAAIQRANHTGTQAISTITGLQAAIDSAGSSTIGTTSVAASYTPILADKGNIISINSATAATFTVPTNASVAYPVGTQLYPRRDGAGLVTIAAAGGVTITQKSGTAVLGAVGKYGWLLKTDTNTWELTVDPLDGSATADPTTNDDSADGYQIGSYWRNSSTNAVFQCFDNTAGSALWIRTDRPAVVPVAANPSGTISGAAVNGSSPNYMRADAVPALSATGVAAGAYTNMNATVDANGRITAASNGSVGGGALAVGTYFGWTTSDLANKPTNSLLADGTNGTVNAGTFASGTGSWLVMGNGAAATPSASPAAGTYTVTQNVTITSTTPSASIYYTTNGVDPTTSDSLYSSPVAIASTGTLKARAYKSLYSPSAVMSAAYTIGGLKTNLVAYYALDEASGNAIDSSGNGRTLTVNGTVGAGSGGPLGSYRSFSTGNYFNLSNAAFRPGSNTFSACGWFYANATGQAYPVLFGVLNNAGGDEWGVLMDQAAGSKPYFIVSTNGTAAAATAQVAGAISASTWYFVAAVADGTNIKISINGGAFVTTAFSGTVFTGTSPFKVGGPVGSVVFNGRMQGVAYWSGRALTLTEIQSIYNGGTGLPYASW